MTATTTRQSISKKRNKQKKQQKAVKHRTAPHRTPPHRTAPHRTAPQATRIYVHNQDLNALVLILRLCILVRPIVVTSPKTGDACGVEVHVYHNGSKV